MPASASNSDQNIVQNIAAVRRFNRFYTRQIGVLRKTYLGSAFSLGEARVLHELAAGPRTATAIGQALDLDAGYLSRVLRDFKSRGLIERTVSKTDARQRNAMLSARGRKAFAPLERRSQRTTGAMLARLPAADRARLIAAMTTIETLLAAKPPAPQAAADATLRAPKPGDFGWIVKRHAELYAEEYGWTEPFEALCARIVADFANNNDPARERCWIAELDGENVGCVFLVKETDSMARLRLLLVDPKARGLKLGSRLTDEAIRFARAAGYKKITLWTHSILTAARHIYREAGFTLTRSEQHQSWGKPVISEFWDLEL